MRIIAEATVREWARQHAAAGPALEHWLALTRQARWGGWTDLCRTFARAVAVLAASGKPVVVFNIAGNRYRLIAAVHYNRQTVNTLRFLTHGQYDQEQTKDQ